MLKKHLAVLVTSGLIISSTGTQDHEINSGVDKTLSVTIAGSPNQSDHLPFSWDIYKDPSRPEFWDDGQDGSLPRPFLYLAGEPSKENARKLKDWQTLQWETIRKIIEALDGGPEELELLSSFVGEPLIDHLMDKDYKNASLSIDDEYRKSLIDWEKVRVVYIYHSKCPACQKFDSVIEELKNKKATIYSFQSDSNTDNPKGWREKFPFKVTPTVYIKYKDHEPVKSEGYTSFREIKKFINNKEKI